MSEVSKTFRDAQFVKAHLKRQYPDCYQYSEKFKYLGVRDIFNHDWGFKVGNTIFDSESKVDTWIRQEKLSHSITSIQTCKKCGKQQRFTLSRQARAWKRIGRNCKRRIGDEIRYQGKTWRIQSFERSYSKALIRIESAKEYNAEVIAKYGLKGQIDGLKEYIWTVQIAILTRTYGQTRIPEYRVLRREK